MTSPTSAAPDPAPRSRFASRVLLLVVGASGNQTGAAIGAHAFGVIGPLGVVAVRQLVSALVLIPLGRPPVRRWNRSQLVPALTLGAVFLVMNSTLYLAIDRIGLGLAVTLEFLGPLALAVALSRSRLDLLCVVGAGAGVWVLVDPGPSSDYLGIGSALLAACCWACYILLNRTLGRRMPAIHAVATASAVCTLFAVPYVIVLVAQGRMTPFAFGCGAVAGVLCSILPYLVDLLALKHVPAGFFGVFMSVNPVVAALAGMFVLGQSLRPAEWIGIVMIVAANAAAGIPAARRARGALEPQPA